MFHERKTYIISVKLLLDVIQLYAQQCKSGCVPQQPDLHFSVVVVGLVRFLVSLVRVLESFARVLVALIRYRFGEFCGELQNSLRRGERCFSRALQKSGKNPVKSGKTEKNLKKSKHKPKIRGFGSN